MASSRIIILPVCAICQDDQAGADILATICGHLFHSACIRQWNNRQLLCRFPTNCPSCNVTLREPGWQSSPARFIKLHGLSERVVDGQNPSQLINPVPEEVSSPGISERLDSLEEKMKLSSAAEGSSWINIWKRFDGFSKQELEQRTANCGKLRIEHVYLMLDNIELEMDRLGSLSDSVRARSQAQEFQRKYQVLKTENDQLLQQSLEKDRRIEELQSTVSRFVGEKDSHEGAEKASQVQPQESIDMSEGLECATSAERLE
ncbi:uncharacterized protein PGTG_06573 [Puccinia graminis f. sp. tritici CRL 75-36-700-3]|uniref:RING-type domain-containing protein n=1 Tax=Puccinia graminis f. sp. tritici (strain CRL 75-36-700-3 / race SCCL) TaxID=418459 RepID=E3K8K8_PUCGT|nr:uncharacterized protein PGTG_06573 [Puccinia graminis f. sp. tritici CRL 75-36-700-3]EFP80617.1 hypothetical protein PGTG_06573 [Puccinia graminis f. sp. tritici CRL 75-36-700-3]